MGPVDVHAHALVAGHLARLDSERETAESSTTDPTNAIPTARRLHAPLFDRSRDDERRESRPIEANESRSRSQSARRFADRTTMGERRGHGTATGKIFCEKEMLMVRGRGLEFLSFLRLGIVVGRH